MAIMVSGVKELPRRNNKLVMGKMRMLSAFFRVVFLNTRKEIVIARKTGVRKEANWPKVRERKKNMKERTKWKGCDSLLFKYL